jgi:hypothetical protein
MREKPSKTQVQLRKEREQLKDEKAALALEVQKQVDAQVQQRESSCKGSAGARRARVGEESPRNGGRGGRNSYRVG